MEFKELIKIIKRNLFIIIAVPILASIFAFILAIFQNESYKIMYSVTIVQKGEDNTEDYKFDNYYSFQAIEKFGESIEKWFQNPEFVLKAHRNIEASEVQIEEIDPTDFFNARKVAPHYMEVTFISRDREFGKKLAKEMVNVLNKELESLKGEKEVWYQIHSSKPYIKNAQINPFLIAALVFTGSVIITIIFSLIKHYLKD